MSDLPLLVHRLAPPAEHYLTLLRVDPDRTYNYAKRGYFDFPVIYTQRHGPKCRIGESWLYFAVPSGVNVGSLGPQDRLYIGAQTQDRMFRGDGLGGENYHHAEMRKGNGDDHPVSFLGTGRTISIFRARAADIADLVSQEPELEPLQVLAKQPRTPRKHLGWWFEQYILLSEWGAWRWNTAPADRAVRSLFALRGAVLSNHSLQRTASPPAELYR